MPLSCLFPPVVARKVVSHLPSHRRRRSWQGPGDPLLPRKRRQGAHGHDHHHDHWEDDAGPLYQEFEFEGFDGSDGGSDDPEDEEEGLSDEEEAEDPWTPAALEQHIEDYLIYMADPRHHPIEEGSPVLRLDHCQHCFSSRISHVGRGRRVLLLNADNHVSVTVPFYSCCAADDVKTDACRGLQHVSLLRLGYFPSTFSQTRNLTTQTYNGELVYLHLGMLRSFHSLHLHAPALSTKAWVEHILDLIGNNDDVIKQPRLEDLLGRTAERFRHLMHALGRMDLYGIVHYPGQLPFCGSCPVCAELVNPNVNVSDAMDAHKKMDTLMDACMSFVHYKNTARRMNAARTKPYVAQVSC